MPTTTKLETHSSGPVRVALHLGPHQVVLLEPLRHYLVPLQLRARTFFFFYTSCIACSRPPFSRHIHSNREKKNVARINFLFFHKHTNTMCIIVSRQKKNFFFAPIEKKNMCSMYLGGWFDQMVIVWQYFDQVFQLLLICCLKNTNCRESSLLLNNNGGLHTCRGTFLW